MARILLICIFCVLLISCGSGVPAYDSSVPTQTGPYITRIDPATISANDVLTVFGFGYSMVKEYNILIIDDIQVFADSYSEVVPPRQGEIESLTFTIPAGIPAGSHTILLYVIDNPSNANLSININ